MKEKVEKCPMCGLPKEKNCDLMVGKSKDRRHHLLLRETTKEKC